MVSNKNDQYLSVNPQSILFQYYKLSFGGQRYNSSFIKTLQDDFLPNQSYWEIFSEFHEFYSGIFSHSGDNFYVSARDGNITKFDSKTFYFEPIQTVSKQTSGWAILDLAISSDDHYMVCCDLSDKLTVLDLNQSLLSSGMQVIALDECSLSDWSGYIFSVSFLGGSSDKVVCGRSGGYITYIDLKTRKQELITCAENKCDVNTVSALYNSEFITLSGHDDCVIRMHDIRTNRNGPVSYFGGHQDGITYINVREDSRYFLSNSKDQTVKVWDPRKPSKSKSDLNFQTISRWDYRRDPIPAEFIRSNTECIPGNFIPKTSSENDVSLMTLDGHTVRYTLIRTKFSPYNLNESRYIYSGSAKGETFIWDFNTGKIVSRNIRSLNNGESMEIVRDVCWHPNRHQIVSSSYNGRLTYWGPRMIHAEPYKLKNLSNNNKAKHPYSLRPRPQNNGDEAIKSKRRSIRVLMNKFNTNNSPNADNEKLGESFNTPSFEPIDVHLPENYNQKELVNRMKSFYLNYEFVRCYNFGGKTFSVCDYEDLKNDDLVYTSDFDYPQLGSCSSSYEDYDSLVEEMNSWYDFT